MLGGLMKILELLIRNMDIDGLFTFNLLFYFLKKICTLPYLLQAVNLTGRQIILVILKTSAISTKKRLFQGQMTYKISNKK